MPAIMQVLIEKWRREGGTQQQLADQLGVTKQRLSNWKQGIERCPDEHFARLAELIEGQPKAKHLLWDYVRLKKQQTEALAKSIKAQGELFGRKLRPTGAQGLQGAR